MDETHSVNSQSPYAASKASADQLSLSYFKSFNLPIKIIRPFNTYTSTIKPSNHSLYN